MQSDKGSLISLLEINFYQDLRAGEPKMARTAACLVAPLRPCVAGGQTRCSCHFRRPFFVSFFGRTKKERKEKKVLE